MRATMMIPSTRPIPDVDVGTFLCADGYQAGGGVGVEEGVSVHCGSAVANR